MWSSVVDVVPFFETLPLVEGQRGLSILVPTDVAEKDIRYFAFRASFYPVMSGNNMDNFFNYGNVNLLS